MATKSSPTLVIGNWKMNLSISESEKLAKELARALAKAKGNFELALCPTFPALPAVAKIFKGKKISLGAQDVFWRPLGPYTGEVSPVVLKELGVEYVIVGHSERRQYLKESDMMVNQKVAALLAEGVVPVVCVGETFNERQSGQKDLVVSRQVVAAFSGIVLKPGFRVVVAYEPVWVIGSGQAVEPQEAQHTAQVIKHSLLDLFPEEVINKQVRIIYGGSVDPSNIATFVGQEPLAGVLIGGASLESKRFLALLKQL